MSNNFITNSKESISLKQRLQKLISASSELKFLVGFFYFSGWQEIYKSLQENSNVTNIYPELLSLKTKMIV
jgi:hypothetical protein